MGSFACMEVQSSNYLVCTLVLVLWIKVLLRCARTVNCGQMAYFAFLQSVDYSNGISIVSIYYYRINDYFDIDQDTRLSHTVGLVIVFQFSGISELSYLCENTSIILTKYFYAVNKQVPILK